MTAARQRDCTAALARCRSQRIGMILAAICRRRTVAPQSAFTSYASIRQLANRYHNEKTDYLRYLARRARISSIEFSYNFNAFSDGECLLHFRFRKQDIERLVTLMGWPIHQSSTSRNRYSTTQILITCVILRRLASPARWRDLEELFGKHAAQLSEIFWEAIEHLLAENWHLVAGPISESLMEERAEMYADAIKAKSNALDNCVGFIDGTVLGIARPKGDLPQRVVYNGHKRKHALKFQVVNTPDGLIQHAYGPVEGRRHDWTLYIRSDLDEVLPNVLVVDGRIYCIFGDSGYNQRWYMEVPFQGSNLTAAQKAFNRAMSRVRITVEWIFKEIKMHFATVDFKRKLKIFEAPVGMLYQASMLLANFRNCIYPNQISRYFNCIPPSLETYVSHKD